MADTSRFNLSLPGATIRNILTLSNKVFTAGSELTNAEKELIRNNLGITSSGETETLTEKVEQNTAEINNLITAYTTKVAELEDAIEELKLRITALEGGSTPDTPDTPDTPVYYTVIWKDEYGKLLKTESVAAGDTPNYGSVPTIPSDGQYSYTFDRWEPAPAPITGDTTYTAQYTKTSLVTPDEPDESDKPEVPEFARAFVNNIPTSNTGTTFTKLDNLPITNIDSIGYYIDTENNRIILQDIGSVTGDYAIQIPEDIFSQYNISVQEFNDFTSSWDSSTYELYGLNETTYQLRDPDTGDTYATNIRIRLIFLAKSEV